MHNVYLCIYDYNLIKDLLEYANTQNELNVVGITTTVGEDIHKLIHLHTDIFILQFSEEQELCTQYLSRIYEDERLHSLKILVLFKELNTDTIHLLLQYDIKNFLIEPFTSKQLIDAIYRECRTKILQDATQWNMDAFCVKVLQDLGIPMHLDGYQYLKTCSMLVFQKTIGKRLVIGDIYTECARIHETTSVRIEKAIRTSVNYAYRTQPEKVCIYNRKPTNSQIILYVSEKLKLYNLL